MEPDDLAGHFIGILLVLAMLSCAAAFRVPEASEPEPSAFEENAASAAPEAAETQPPAFSPSVAFSP
jgi:hypothetical protein